MNNKSQTQIIKKTTYDIDKPLQMIEMAGLLKNHIVKNKLYVEIANKNYVMVEGWQFAGGLMGLFPKVVKIENTAPGKWLAQVEIINKDDKVISSGFALCSKEENRKKTFDEYAILSMAQTRAIGKAYRNLIGWVMKLTGYESTPAEEMKKEGIINNDPLPQKTEIQGEKNAKLNELKSMLKGKTDTEKIADLKKQIGIILKNFDITEKHAGILIAYLLNKTTK